MTPTSVAGNRSSNTAKTGLAGLDFLHLPLIPGDGVDRRGAEFRIDIPWALARFGPIALRGGWWRIECKAKGRIGPSELRLSAPWDPLIVARLEETSQVRIYLRRGVYDVSLLLGAWPGVASFEELAFRCAGPLAGVKVIAGALARLSRQDRPLEILTRAARRVLAGQSMGLRTAPLGSAAGPASETAAAATTSARNDFSSGPSLIVRRGGIVAVLREGDQLHADAFKLAEDEFVRHPELRAIYSDIEEAGRILPHPEWDIELTTHFPYSDAPVFLRAHLAADDHMAKLASIAQRHGPTAIGRIPLPLAKRERGGGPLAALEAPVLARTPRVSVIVPTKHRADLFELCLESLARQTGYPDVQVVVVDNGASDPRFPAILAAAGERLDLVKVEDFGPFNFSRLINRGVERSNGEILLLLNDDVLAREPGWLHRMVDSAMRTNVGAVGARLTYADGGVQHAGVMLGLGGVCGHLWKGMSRSAAAANPYVSLPGSRLAVTAACLAVRRDAFEEVSGFDEGAFPVAFNDIDFCLRLHARGFRNIYRGDAWLIHHESQSRGTDDASLSRRRRLVRETRTFLDRWGRLLVKDPYGSPAFDYASQSGAVHPAAQSAPELYASPIQAGSNP